MTTRLMCTCRHDYQDKRCGKNIRVMNRMKTADQNAKYRRTVCGATRGA